MIKRIFLTIAGISIIATQGILGAPSDTIYLTVTVEDSTPPAATTGLSAAAGDSMVSLSWNVNSESDLAGYNVYRSQTQGGPYTKINTSLISQTT